MIRRILAFIFGVLASLASPAFSAEVVVQAGDHPDFTRLSFHVDQAEWRLGRVEGGYGLRLSGGPEFVISDIFDRISRRHISELRLMSDGLDLVLACTCHARVFRYQDIWLVVDIVEGAPPAVSAHEARLVPEQVVSIDRGSLPLFLPATPRPESLSIFAPLSMHGADPAPHVPVALLRDDRVTQEMAQSIFRAAELGLLDLARSRSRPASAPVRPEAPPLRQLSGYSPAVPGIHAHNSLDAVFALSGRGPAVGCLGDELFDLALWAGQDDLFTELARIRADTTDATGVITAETAAVIARLYLAYGFGREAEDALAFAPNQGMARDIMLLLARVIDNRPVDPVALADQAGCGGHVMFWRALIHGSVTDLDETGQAAVITAFRRLPDVLRRQLAPRVALIFAESGDALAADEILKRDSTESDPMTAMRADIQIARTSQDVEATVLRLDRAIQTDPHTGPQALIEMVDLVIAGHWPDASVDPDLLTAARFETRGSPVEHELTAAQVRLLSHIGAHRAALDLVTSLPLLARGPTLSEIIAELVENAADDLFLDLVFAPLPEGLSAEGANAIAARLLVLGFPEQALALMQAVAPDRTLAERRYLRGQAAALMGRADLVEAELIGLEDPRADMIRGLLFPDAGNLTLTVTVEQEDMQLPLGPLAQSNALIQEAEATRDRTRALLDLIASSSDAD